MTGSITVTGGPGEIDAELAGLLAYAGLLDRMGDAVAEVVAQLARTVADPAMLAAGLLDPVGGAALALRLGGAATLAAAVEAASRGLAASLRAAVVAYRAADSLDAQVLAAAGTAQRLPTALRLLAARPNGAGLQAAVLADPGLVDLAVHSLSGAAGASAVSAALSQAYPDGDPVLTRRPDWPVDDRLGPPRDLAGLLRGVAVRECDDDGGGAVDVRFLRRVGSPLRHVVVDISGTTIWNADPWRRSPQATDMGTNLRSLAGRPSVMSRGVIAAMIAAGVRPDDEVLLVGHSQGGMVGAEVVATLAHDARFRIAGLVTAGSPIGMVHLPRSVPVLSLENAGDPVPHLDGVANPAEAGWLTVHGSEGGPTVLDQHAVQTYQAIAADADASRAPALVDWRRARAGFFDADSVETVAFQIRRDP